MMKTLSLTTVLYISLVACTQNQDVVEVEPTSRKGSEAPSQSSSPAEKPAQRPGSSLEYKTRNQVATIPVSLNETQIQQTFAVSTNALTYSFSYLTVTRSGPIQFVNGVANIQLTGLPVGQSGTMRFNILEDNKVSIYGVKDGVTLSAGANTQKLVLRKVDGNSRGSLQIDLKLDDIRSLIDGTTPPPNPGQPPLPGPEQPPGPAPQLNQVGKEAMDILVKHCSECHHPGRPNVFSQLPFRSSFSSDTKTILQKVISVSEAKTMPPQPRDPLTAAEIAKLKAWLAAQ